MTHPKKSIIFGFETLLDHGINEGNDNSKLSVAWLTRKMSMENEEKFNFLFLFYLFFGGSSLA